MEVEAARFAEDQEDPRTAIGNVGIDFLQTAGSCCFRLLRKLHCRKGFQPHPKYDSAVQSRAVHLVVFPGWSIISRGPKR